MKTVVVLGASYGGNHASNMLAKDLPAGWRVVTIDRNTHFNHLYAFPRFTVIPHEAQKGFIPYRRTLEFLPESHTAPTTPPLTPPASPPASTTGAVTTEEVNGSDDKSRHQFIQGCITKLTPHSVTFIRPREPENGSSSTSGSGSSSKGNNDLTNKVHAHLTYGKYDGEEEIIEFEYALYALGASMPDPVNVWQDSHLHEEGVVLGSKKAGLKFMKSQGEKFKSADRILVVGGGALGIEYAGDLQYLYPEKKITLLHSRQRLMPVYPVETHTRVLESFQKLGVEVVLGERVMSWPEEMEELNGKTKIVTTDKGRIFEADLVLACTGQKPHISLMASISPALISPTTSRIRVSPTMQVHRGADPAKSTASTAEQLAAMSLSALPTPPASARTSVSDSDSRPSEEVREEEEDLSHIFAIGDCAETGAIQAGHTAYWQGEVAARNILKLVNHGKEVEKLEEYVITPPAIKLTVGFTTGIVARGDLVEEKDDGVEDLQSMVMWPNPEGGEIDITE
ncbi:hypothetical protein CI109_100474 [Kwoniella shandongensis]|uniref:Uncharacterized protein n=1 Tax=Kwoniella shandongensis TaxID=1734106 RepID=A0A5M6C3U2_9TREE|nr:uncharacterized protein CI109_001683 [Kwoniella shandongensis]KAA5529744.1 hypothetical protein CI109_001683 [Kwoniella shandongensis]